MIIKAVKGKNTDTVVVVFSIADIRKGFSDSVVFVVEGRSVEALQLS